MRLRRRLVGRWLAVLCVLLLAAGIAGMPIYVRPQTDSPRHADAILILGGPGWERYPFGIELGAKGWAPTVVISNPEGTADPWLTEKCATPPRGLTLHCFAPDPPTTLGEGRELRRLAERYHWRTVIVVTFRPHISRARYILERCFGGELVMVVSPAHLSVGTWAYQYVYQTAGYVRAVPQAPC